MESLIFKFLCGILYVIGLCLGFSYQEISVYICIYLWPILCIFSTLVIIYSIIKNIILNKHYILNGIGLIIATFYSYSYLLVFDSILNHYDVKHNTINQIFNLCYNDLIEISNKLNITYEYLNLFIYCKLFFIIIITNLFIKYLICKFNK